MPFFEWMRHNSEEYLLEASQRDMAKRYGIPAPRVQKKGSMFWRYVFTPIYRLLPWRLRQAIIVAMPGSHRRWLERAPPSASRTPLEQSARPMEETSQMAKITGERVPAGQAIVDYDEKVFPDYNAEPGQKAYVFMHTVPFEGSVGIVNMLTTTRLIRKGFDTSLVLFGPASLMASATRGFPNVGDEAFPGHLNYNHQLKTIMDEGGHIYACRFSAAALYGMREVDMMEGVKPIHPRDVADAAIQAWREGAFQMNTWNL